MGDASEIDAAEFNAAVKSATKGLKVSSLYRYFTCNAVPEKKGQP